MLNSGENGARKILTEVMLRALGDHAIPKLPRFKAPWTAMDVMGALINPIYPLVTLWIFPWKMVIFHGKMLVHQRVTL